MAYKQRWLVYFDHFDTNHNGFIEPEDFALIGKVTIFILIFFIQLFISFIKKIIYKKIYVDS